MKSLRVFVLLAAVVALLAAWTQLPVMAQETAKKEAPPAKVHDYVGAATCGMCHKGEAKGTIYEIWQKSKHASAYANLPEESKKDPTCLACHATGAGKPGVYTAKETPKPLEGVTCEGCHGPGKDYKGMAVMKVKADAEAAGLIMPDETTCKGCHEGTFPKGHKEVPKFDFAAMSKVIAHHIPAPPAKTQ